MKYISLILGLLFLSLGTIFAFIPFLPTTPFLLISAFFFAHSSKKANLWFKGTKIYKNHIEDFKNGNGLTKKAKLHTLSIISFVFLIGMYFSKTSTIAVIVIATVWILHIFGFIFLIKTKESV